jgi:hypothetical protein
MTKVLTDVVSFLSTNVAGISKGTNLFQGPPRGPNNRFPKLSVFVQSLPGEEPVRTMQEVSEHRFANVSIIVRWKQFAAGDTLTRLIQDTLQAASISGYLDVVALQSEPSFIGEDAENNFIWSMGYQLIYEVVK